MTKYVLVNEKKNYRSFLYLQSGYVRGNEAKLDDLYNNFYYVSGMIKVDLSGS